MGALKLELHHTSQRVGDNDIDADLDPEPDWSFDALVSELNALENKLGVNSSTQPLHFHKTTSRLNLSGGKEIEKGRSFVFCAPEYETESEDDDDDDKALVSASTGKRFNYDELYLSDSDDDSDVDPAFEVQPYLMNKVGEVEGALIELTQEHQLRVKDEIRSKISVLETSLLNESQNSISSLLRVEKFKETRQELDKKFDTQYQRQIAEALDSHLTAVQRDRELRSQIEERKIRNDAAHEEAKKKVAMQEEKQQKEKAKAEAEAKLKAEEVKQAALEAERKATTEAKSKAAMEAEKRAAAEAERRAEKDAKESTKSSPLNTETKESGYVYRAAANALNIEQGRLQKLKELCEGNQIMRSSSKQDYTRYESHISRNIKTIRGISHNVRSKASELINLLNDRQCPQSISAEIFVKKVVSSCSSPGSAPFAIAYVIVLITSKVPYVMDLLLAELHRACLYTVPKHMVYKTSIFQSKEAYFRSIGYREDGEKLEGTEDYLKRLESYMKLYGALVQTEIPNIQNLHGLQEGWAWLARFLNYMPANLYTAVSLDTFLQMAGFALFQRYKSQFLKMLNAISDNFLVGLKSQNVPESTRIVANIKAYIEDKKFCQVPEGRKLQSDTMSRVLM
ncbi:mRNA export factor GLE1-like [Trifolium pratense]|uniref:mRNA export factor GLE1-like n=1 Tax=Trifolium pratense TaxID=57577 RepID=UPI001E697902|nr:mRNA export factor GLE1-like [Trifolium pratense]